MMISNDVINELVALKLRAADYAEAYSEAVAAAAKNARIKPAVLNKAIAAYTNGKAADALADAELLAEILASGGGDDARG